MSTIQNKREIKQKVKSHCSIMMAKSGSMAVYMWSRLKERDGETEGVEGDVEMGMEEGGGSGTHSQAISA